MTIRQSTALCDYLNETGSWKSAFQNAVIELYSGSQPASADAATTGNLLCTITVASGAITNEVAAQGSVTFSGTVAGGTCTGITVNSIQIMGSTFTDATGVLADFATGVAAIINNNPKNWLYTASASAGVVTLTAKPGIGVLSGVSNGAVVSTVTGISKSDVNMGSVTAAVSSANGLRFGDSAAGTMVKDSSQIWSGVGTAAAATGTAAGWFRLKGSKADAGALDSVGAYLRMDGTIATSGADMTVSSTTIVSGSTFTLNVCSPTEPASA